MCGIAGFSLSPNSKIKPRQLSNALLTAIEDRGYMASGYGWHSNGEHGYHSAATPGSSLSLKFMPRKSNTVILHTRLATHGAVSDNRNNHPVTSPDGNIALVHNGVIYNHDEVRRKVTGELPPVDTSVIPAVIEQHGVASLNLLYGDAAIAWLDKRDPGTLHFARYQHSPLVFVQVEDGSFIFASTEALLWRALIQLDIVPTFMHSPDELLYYTVRDGVIESQQMLPEPLYSDVGYDYSYYRHQTSGAKGTAEPYKPDNSVFYGDEFEFEFDEDYEYDWGQYGDYPKVMGSPEQSSSPREKFWLEIRSEIDSFSQHLWYFESERDLWIDELYSLANEPGTELVDYGTVDSNGFMQSSKASVDF